MKRVSGFVSAALVLLLCAGALATAQAEPRNNRSRSKILLQSNEERYVRITGSHIPQRVTVRSIGTTTPYNVRIYTREELESTGRHGVHGLVIDPAIRIHGSGGF